MLQMTDEMQALLWAVNYRLGELRIGLEYERVDPTIGVSCLQNDKIRRLEGNIGASGPLGPLALG